MYRERDRAVSFIDICFSRELCKAKRTENGWDLSNKKENTTYYAAAVMCEF